MESTVDIPADARGMRVAIVASAYHAQVTEAMLEAARAEFVRLGGAPSALLEARAPGAFELPLLVDAALSRPDVAAAVAIGCIVRGQTRHDRHLGAAVTHGLLGISVARGKPVGLAVLTVEDMRQARARAGGKHGNKGRDAMHAAVAAAAAAEEFRR